MEGDEAPGRDVTDVTASGDDQQAAFDAAAEADRERVTAANQIARDRSMVAYGRRVGGLPGAMVAGAMIALRDIYESPKRDDGSVVVEAPDEPHDVDRDGVFLTPDEIGGISDVAIPSQPRLDPLPVARRRSRRRRD